MEEQKDNKLNQSPNIRNKSMEAPKEDKETQTVDQNNINEKTNKIKL